MIDAAHSTIAQVPGEEDVTTTLYRAAVGPLNTGYYLPIFTRFEVADHAGISWNMAASLCTLNWLVLRQLWGAALGYASIVVALALLVFGIGHLVLQFSDTLMMALGLGFGLAAFVLPGLFGNALLHHECRKRMAKALAAHANVADACTQLERQAPTRRRVIWLAAANAVLLLAAGVAYLQFSSLSVPTAMPQGAVEEGHVAVGPTTQAAASGPATMAASAPEAGGASAPASVPAHVSSAAMPVGNASAPMPAVHASDPKATAAPSASAPSVALPSSASAIASTPAANSVASAPSPSSVQAPHIVASTATMHTAPKPAAPVSASATAPASVQPPTSAIHAGNAGKITDNTTTKPNKAETTTHKAAASEKPKKAATQSAQGKPPAKAKKPYYVNVGLFAQPDNATNANNKLVEAHIPSATKAIKSSKGPLTRVRAGPFASEEEAKAAIEKIKALQLDAIIVAP